VPYSRIKFHNKTTQQPPYLESLPSMIHSTLQRTATALLSLSLVTATPIFSTISLAQSAPTRIAFRDAGSWADPFIGPLADRGIISGFQDQTFRPEALVNRAQFAVMLVKAFPTMGVIRGSQRFADVPSNYWAAASIDRAYRAGFLESGGQFNPEQFISREEAFSAIVRGFNYRPDPGSLINPLSYYQDGADISSSMLVAIAAAGDSKLIVNYPEVKRLNPRANLTRGQLASLLYQSLVNQGQLTGIRSSYIVGQSQPTPVFVKPVLRSGSQFISRYEQTERLLIAPNDKLPMSVMVRQDLGTNGVVLIPAGSRIVGELRSVKVKDKDRAQFFGSEVFLPNGQKKLINVSSTVITDRETIRKGAKSKTILTGAAAGAGAGALIGVLTGNKKPGALEVLGGAGLGAGLAALLGRDRVELVVLKPNSELTLTLDADYAD
jgi:hypothetical protein